MSTPEWDIFSRIDELENITLDTLDKIEHTEPILQKLAPSVRDNHILATYAYGWSFLALALMSPSSARKQKNAMVKRLKRLGLSNKRLETVSEFMTKVCDDVEDTK